MQVHRYAVSACTNAAMAKTRLQCSSSPHASRREADAATTVAEPAVQDQRAYFTAIMQETLSIMRTRGYHNAGGDSELIVHSFCRCQGPGQSGPYCNICVGVVAVVVMLRAVAL